MIEQGCVRAHAFTDFLLLLYDYRAQPKVAFRQNLFVPQQRWPKTKVKNVAFAGGVVLVRPPQKALRKPTSDAQDQTESRLKKTPSLCDLT